MAHSIGKIITALGVAMALPMAVDWWQGNPHWTVFLEAGAVTVAIGLLITVATRGDQQSLNIQQAFLITSGLWAVLPVFGAIPFVIGEPQAGLTDAYFEAMSGLTTTGTTAFPELDRLSYGVHLWRTILHWSGGLGIVVVAMVFLPVPLFDCSLHRCHQQSPPAIFYLQQTLSRAENCCALICP